MKRIIICADGTWNVRDQVNEETGKRRPSNVTKLARAILPVSPSGTNQVTVYHDGLGTNKGVDKFTGGAFGRGIEEVVRSLYRSIVYNYVPGDELYLFGFSRGAFTVRTLAGFMKFAGLMEKDDDYYVPDMYACYESQQGPGTAQWVHANRNVHGTRPCPPIRMIGVWDTVGSLGAPGAMGQWLNRGKYRYHDVGLHPEIQHAYQALAIDEQRKPFSPDVWDRPAGWAGTLEQAWFAGVHSNVGGGYTPDGLANEALHWIASKAHALGLALDRGYLNHFQGHHDSKLFDSMTLKYKLLGKFVRPIGASQQGGESLHESAVERLSDPTLAYAPDNATAFRTLGSDPIARTTWIE